MNRPTPPTFGRLMAAVLGGIVALRGGSTLADDAFFEAKVRPVLAGRCVQCHGPRKQSAGLRLDSARGMAEGGESGPAVVASKPAESLLVRAIRRQDDVAAMPPDAPLPSDAVAALERWIAEGAAWPSEAAPVQAARHWAFEPVRDVTPPAVPGRSDVHPIDAFLAEAQRKRGVTPAAPADRRTLIRRATFDLIGLPPTPEEVEAFLTDGSPRAFEAVIDRLLASPHYGEKWGRAWLDVARYADTAGETADFPVPDAWRYRNYVIDAFNADRPYDQFLREQVAGDLLAAGLPDDAPPGRFGELTSATGFLAVSRRFGFDTSKDQHLTIDDTIDTLGKAVLGLTIGCARCHDHKYDPISAADYYALYGIFDSTRYPSPGCEKDRAPRDFPPLLSAAELRRRIGPPEARVASAERALAEAERRVAAAAAGPSAPLASGDLANGGEGDVAASTTVRKGQMIRLTVAPKSGHGADSTRVDLRIAERDGTGRAWDVTRDILPDVERGGPGFRAVDAVWHVWDGAGLPRPLATFERDAEKTKGLFSWRGGEPTPCVFANANDRPVAFVTVRQPARSLALHPGPKGPVVLAWESPIDGAVTIAGRVEDVDSSSGDGVAWSIAVGPGLGGPLREVSARIVERDRARRELETARASLPRGYAVAEGRPHNARIFLKGEPETLGDEVPRRFLDVLGGRPVTSGSGRRELAEWIAAPKNPLTARVMVNRVWQGHFGVGLVRTPDNFGVRGEPPTHPELLDWLAARFVADGWSIKALHRRMMLSDAYRRSSGAGDSDLRADPVNVTLGRFGLRRLAAEEIRDAMLAVSGDLDPTLGGPHPFPPAETWRFTQHNPFVAVYDHDRRSVYLMTQRIKRHPFLALFDGPDPNATTGRRDSTTVPTQALFFLNDPFVHARAASLAGRLAALPDDATRLDWACRLLYGRPPGEGDRRVAALFAVGDDPRAAWSARLRVLFASNEFLYVD